MIKNLLLVVLGTVAAIALGACGPTSSSALRHNDGVPIYSFGSGGGASAPC